MDKLCKSLVGASLIFIAQSAQGAIVVDWGGDYVDASLVTPRAFVGSTVADIDGNAANDRAAGRPFSLSTALNPGVTASGPTRYDGTNAIFYGGVSRARSSSGSSPGVEDAETRLTVVQNGSTDALSLTTTGPSSGTARAGGSVVFLKSNFLSGGDAVTLSLDQSSAGPKIDGVSMNITGINIWKAHLLVQNGSTLYVSSTAYDTTGLKALDSVGLASETWKSVALTESSFALMDIAPNSASLGAAVASSTLTNITGIGVAALTDLNGGLGFTNTDSTALTFDSFEVSAVVPEPATAGILMGGFALAMTRRQQRRVG